MFCLSWYNIIVLSVPSFIYLGSNNLSFLILRHSDPATYEILTQLKIVSSCILWRLVFNKSLETNQYYGVVILLIGKNYNTKENYLNVVHV